MRCTDAMKHVDAFRTGEIPAGVRREVAGHLSECGACAEALASIRHLTRQFRAMAVRAPKQIIVEILTKTTDRYAKVETDLGNFWVACSPRGITHIERATRDAAAFEKAYRSRLGRPIRPGLLPDRLALAVRQGTSGIRPVSTRIDLSASSEFERKVLLLLRKIPRGEVRPYSWLAREAGHPKAVRAVGNTLARNPIPFILPCHRVVPLSGGIGRYAFGSSIKRDLLIREKAPVSLIEELAQKGVHYIGCKTTGIYCLPTCHAARRIREENTIPFHTLEDVRAADFRPCRLCRPQAVGG